MESAGVRISAEGEWATWVAHGTLMGLTVGTSDVVLGSPWYGYAAGLGGTFMWEASEHNERAKAGIRQARGWTTAMDVLVPVTFGYVLSKLLDRHDDKTIGPGAPTLGRDEPANGRDNPAARRDDPAIATDDGANGGESN